MSMAWSSNWNPETRGMCSPSCSAGVLVVGTVAAGRSTPSAMPSVPSCSAAASAAASCSRRAARVASSRAARCSAAVATRRRNSLRPGWMSQGMLSLRPIGLVISPSRPAGRASSAASRRRPWKRAADLRSACRAACRAGALRTAARLAATAPAVLASRWARFLVTAPSRAARAFRTAPPNSRPPRPPRRLARLVSPTPPPAPLVVRALALRRASATARRAAVVCSRRPAREPAAAC